MAGLVGQWPSKHLTARAEWWLRHATYLAVRNVVYPVVHGLPVCAMRRTPEAGLGQWLDVQCVEGWSCGVEDVRSIYINAQTSCVGYDGDMVRDGVAVTPHCADWREVGRTWQFREVNYPTCPECRVVFDEALERITPKYGKYPTDVQNGALVRWRSL